MRDNPDDHSTLFDFGLDDGGVFLRFLARKDFYRLLSFKTGSELTQPTIQWVPGLFQRTKAAET
jgi:hypothetical protein